MRRVLLAVAVMVASNPSQAQKKEENLLHTLLVVGKGSGACGILTLQIQFQEGTKMSGGNEFVGRFWTTEAARLGMTLDQYGKFCAKTLDAYDTYWKMTER
jgi:hypothetical protein